MGNRLFILKKDLVNFRTFTFTLESQEKWFEWNEKFKVRRSFANEWEKINLKFFEGESKKDQKEEMSKRNPDFTGGYLSDCCSLRGRKVIESIAPDEIEVLPINTPCGTYFDMNLQEVDCLDRERSVLKLLPPDLIIKVFKYSIFWERIKNLHIFWIKGLGIHQIYVSEEMKRLLESANFPELSFTPIPLVDETSVPRG